MNKSNFTLLLIEWDKNFNKRVMPWKGEKDPYKIWLSEIILQQTRVEQGWAYYEKFIEQFPTIKKLAEAKDETVFKLWEGLGYYNRCKNLLFTARKIVSDNNGCFPATYEELLNLKGVGPYTAAAIASFAFNLPYAVVDGNVFRVLARVFGKYDDINSSVGKSKFTQLAQEVLDKKQAGKYNQAIMDFGATVCKPMLAACNNCIMQKICVAHNSASVNKLPVKENMLIKKKRWFYYFLLRHDGKILINKRTQKDIWENLFEFYLVETEQIFNWNKEGVQDWLKEQFGIRYSKNITISPVFTQQLTHQNIKGQFILIDLKRISKNLQKHFWIEETLLHTLAFPKFINQFLALKSVQSELF